MINMIRSLIAPFTSLALMMMASGLFNTFVSVRLEIEGFKTEEIGIVISSLYLGFLLGSIWTDRLISKMGHIPSFIFFGVAIAILVLLQIFWIDPWYWSILRLFGGYCMAGIFIVMESWLLLQSGNEARGTVFAFYLIIAYGGLSLGQFLIDLSPPEGMWPFFITSGLLLISIIPIAMGKVSAPKIKEAKRLSVFKLFKISPLGLIGTIFSGILLAGIYGLVPVYAKEVGMSISDIGTFMAVLIFGGLCLQWPLGYWADKTNRKRVLMVAAFFTALLSVAIAFLDHSIPLSLLFLLTWAFGGFAFTLYPLSIGHACEHLKDEQIVAATGGFVLSYGFGAIVGPLLAPIAMELLGDAGLFYFFATTSGIICLLGFSPLLKIEQKQ